MRWYFLIPITFLLACNPERQPANRACHSPVKTELYFGLKIDSATVVSNEEFNHFIHTHLVSAGLGLTVLDAEGRWLNTATGKTDSENSKVVILVYDGCDTSITTAISKAVRVYNSSFSQQSVLRVDNPVSYDFVEER